MAKGRELLHYPQHAPLRRKRLAPGAEAVGRKRQLQFQFLGSNALVDLQCNSNDV